MADWNDTCTLGALPVVYGTKGIPSAGDVPRYASNAATWTDKSGNLWLYSGSYSSFSALIGVTSASSYTWNDLWEYDTSANEWTWINGSGVTASSGLGVGAILGTQGVPAAGNSPGGVFGVPSWTDGNGSLWMFDGLVWKFQPSAPAPVPSFALSLSSASISVVAGGNGTSVLTTLVGDGFNSAVALSASGQPSVVSH